MEGSGAPVAAGEDEDSWVCKKCGWTYPNPHPSAKHRRNHRKQCGKLKGLQKPAAPPLQHDAGSSDNVSSDDEDHHHHQHPPPPAPEASHIESVKVEEKPVVTEEPKTAPEVESREQTNGFEVPGKDSVENSHQNEISTETRDGVVKVDPQKVGILEEAQPVSKAPEEPEAVPTTHNEPSEPVVAPVLEKPPAIEGSEAKPDPIQDELESLKHDKVIEVSSADEPKSTKEDKLIEAASAGGPESLKEDKVIDVSGAEEPKVLKEDKLIEAAGAEEPGSLDKVIEVSPAEEPKSLKEEPSSQIPLQGGAAPSQDSWEQLLDAQLAVPQQIVSDTSSSANNETLSSTAFPESSFTAEKELSAPSNGNPFVPTPQTQNTDANAGAGAGAGAETTKPEAIERKAAAPDAGEASSSKPWKTKEGEEDIKPHIALKALFDEDPKPKQEQQQQQAQSAYTEEQEALVRSESRRNSNVLQRVIDTVRNSPAKFTSGGGGGGATTKKNEELPQSLNTNRSKSRWSSYICCSQVR